MNGFWRAFCKIWLRANVGIHIRKVLIKIFGGPCVCCRRSIDFCPRSRQFDRGWFLTDHRLWMQYSSVTYPSTHIWWGGFILKIVNKHFLGLLFLINVVWQRHCQLSTQFDENTWRSRVWMRSILWRSAVFKHGIVILYVRKKIYIQNEFWQYDLQNTCLVGKRNTSTWVPVAWGAYLTKLNLDQKDWTPETARWCNRKHTCEIIVAHARRRSLFDPRPGPEPAQYPRLLFTEGVRCTMYASYGEAAFLSFK
jgi:hypothetical protein